MLQVSTLGIGRAVRRGAWLSALTILLSACSNKPVHFTDYIAEHLLRNNLNELAEPPIFEVASLTIREKEQQGDKARAIIDVALHFPEDFDTVVSMHKLEPYNIAYLQYKSSFGEFAAGETQVHHAEYQFQRRDNKWVIVGSRPVSQPDISKPGA
ncbi:hypothetical protein I6N98_04415 [Spongiibacter nanhainus]|uniref:DUF4440 domain-containing protein n=1 Tax=Spongiibacter nanhainus TaxID=2794344 RepID=A0A7T4R2A5_9GAMM|nr:hypothetical protein [Spongiibacter nanhainus]QQD19105.1 hypothetical protein I6N98_04415 [Spongiibacter nanhainus]